MDRSEVITLIAEAMSQDDNGVRRKTETKKDVFCQVDSVSRDEFYAGGRNGLNPEFRFTMFGPDYDGQRVIEFRGQRYGVYRTFQRRTDVLELYVERKGGTNTAPVVENEQVLQAGDVET